MEPKDILNKISSAHVIEITANIDGQTVKYKRIILGIEVNETILELELMPSKAQGKSAYQFLDIADELK